MNECRVEVALPVPVYRNFSYSSGIHPEETLAVGSMVEVELGRRRLRGVVVSTGGDGVNDEFTCKPVLERLPFAPLRDWQLQLALNLSRRYFAAYGEVLGFFVPPYRSQWQPLSEWRVLPGAFPGPLSPRSAGENFSLWKKAKQLRKPEVDRMVKRGDIVLVKAGRNDGPAVRADINSRREFQWQTLPYREDREALCEEVLRHDLESEKKTLLVFPDVHSLDRSIRFLGDTLPQARLIRYDGRLTPRDRYLAFLRAEEGDYDMICGTHIACFLPLDHVSEHILFDPDERGHGADRFPRYDSLTVLRGKVELTGGGFRVVGVSPDLQLFYGLQEGLYRERKAAPSTLQPPGRTIRSVVQDRKRSVLSTAARLEIGSILKRGGRAIVWIQKSGYAAALGCRDCGFYYTCPQCETATRFYREDNTLQCPLCGWRDTPKTACPQCRGVSFDHWGFAVESAFEEVRKSFPGAAVELVEGEMDWNESRISLSRPDILVGTTAVLRESLLRNSELFIVASLDDWLRIPDFRARESLFLLLKKVAAYLGIDAAGPPCIMVQTSSMFEKQVGPLFESPQAFYRDELSKRRRIAYPPYAGLLRIVIQGGNRATRDRVCTGLAERMNAENFSAYGPHPVTGLRKKGAVSDEVIVHFHRDRQEELYALVKQIFPTRHQNGVRAVFENL